MSSHRPLRLSDAATVRVLYEDVSPFGSALGDRLGERIRYGCRDIVAARRARGMASVVAASSELIAAAMREPELSDLYVRRGYLSEECLYPSPQDSRPVALLVQREDRTASVRIPNGTAGDVARWMGDWANGASPPTRGSARGLWQQLRDEGAIDDLPGAPEIDADLIFLGHASVAQRHAGVRLLVDPFLFPLSGRYPTEYQPIAASELGSIDGVFITHGHPDHYDLNSLFRFGADVPIHVPTVERESILSVDIAMRLEQLGFTNVRRLTWGETAQIGSLRVTALPLRGEQPTCGPHLHPDVRNHGNVYVVDTGERRVAYTADSGVDGSGGILNVAIQAREQLGPIDTLFGTNRGFPVYPALYLFSSVPEYLLFVPEGQWAARQKIMNDAHDLLDTAEAWGAQRVVPYATGGAPWYADAGIGPNCPPVAGFRMTDPPPEAVADLREARSETGEGLIASPVQVCILRPGESLDASDPGDPARHHPGHVWPYGVLQRSRAIGIDSDPGLLLRSGEDVALTRKKVLLRLLALSEAERRGISASAEALQAMADVFRVRFGLLAEHDMQTWLDAEGLAPADFVETLRQFVLIERLSELLRDEIDAGVNVAVRVNTAQAFDRSRNGPGGDVNL